MKIDVNHIAKLANIPLNKNEEEKFEKQLSSILDYIDTLKKADTSNITETSQVTGLENITREDEARPSLTQEEALLNTKHQHNGMIKVSAILEE